MLDTLFFLLERLFSLAHIYVSLPRLVHVEREHVSCTRRDDVSWSRYARGDLLEVPRTLFTHFGIYLGDGRVAHLIPDALPLVTSEPRRLQRMVTNTRLLLGVLSKRASVRVDSVEDFAYGAHVLLNRADTYRAALSGEESGLRAERLIGPVSYSLLWNNCEHFVTHCRYGHADSLQTEQFCSWLKSAIRDPRTLLASVVVGALMPLSWGASLCTLAPALLLPFTLWMSS